MTVSSIQEIKRALLGEEVFVLEPDEIPKFLEAAGIRDLEDQDTLLSSIEATFQSSVSANASPITSVSSSEAFTAMSSSEPSDEEKQAQATSLEDFSWLHHLPEVDNSSLTENSPKESSLQKDSKPRVTSGRKRSKATKKKSIKHLVNELMVDNVKRVQKKVFWTKAEEQRVSFWYGHFVQQKVDCKGISAAVASKMASEGFPKRPGKEYNNKWRRQLRPGLRVLAQYEWTSDDIRALEEHVAEFGARKWGTFTEKTNIPDHLARYKWMVLTKKKDS